MRKGILLAVVISLVAVSFAHAEQGELGVTFDLTYMSKWLSKGAEVYGQQGAFFETVDVDLYDTGFGFKVVHRSATNSGNVNKSRFDFRPYYKNKFFKDTPYVMNYNIITI